MRFLLSLVVIVVLFSPPGGEARPIRTTRALGKHDVETSGSNYTSGYVPVGHQILNRTSMNQMDVVGEYFQSKSPEKASKLRGSYWKKTSPKKEHLLTPVDLKPPALHGDKIKINGKDFKMEDKAARDALLRYILNQREKIAAVPDQHVRNFYLRLFTHRMDVFLRENFIDPKDLLGNNEVHLSATAKDDAAAKKEVSLSLLGPEISRQSDAKLPVPLREDVSTYRSHKPVPTGDKAPDDDAMNVHGKISQAWSGESDTRAKDLLPSRSDADANDAKSEVRGRNGDSSHGTAKDDTFDNSEENKEVEKLKESEKASAHPFNSPQILTQNSLNLTRSLLVDIAGKLESKATPNVTGNSLDTKNMKENHLKKLTTRKAELRVPFDLQPPKVLDGKIRLNGKNIPTNDKNIKYEVLKYILNLHKKIASVADQHVRNFYLKLFTHRMDVFLRENSIDLSELLGNTNIPRPTSERDKSGESDPQMPNPADYRPKVLDARAPYQPVSRQPRNLVLRPGTHNSPRLLTSTSQNSTLDLLEEIVSKLKARQTQVQSRKSAKNVSLKNTHRRKGRLLTPQDLKPPVIQDDKIIVDGKALTVDDKEVKDELLKYILKKHERIAAVPDQHVRNFYLRLFTHRMDVFLRENFIHPEDLLGENSVSLKEELGGKIKHNEQGIYAAKSPAVLDNTASDDTESKMPDIESSPQHESPAPAYRSPLKNAAQDDRSTPTLPSAHDGMLDENFPPMDDNEGSLENRLSQRKQGTTTTAPEKNIKITATTTTKKPIVNTPWWQTTTAVVGISVVASWSFLVLIIVIAKLCGALCGNSKMSKKRHAFTKDCRRRNSQGKNKTPPKQKELSKTPQQITVECHDCGSVIDVECSPTNETDTHDFRKSIAKHRRKSLGGVPFTSDEESEIELVY